MDPTEFRTLGHELVDWVADYRERIGELPVMSRVQPGEIEALLPAAPPQQPEGLAAIAADLDRIVLPGITHWNHPGWFAYFPSNTDLTSVLADIVAGGLGPQGMSWQTSPAATEVEVVVMSWLRQMLGLSEAFSGVIHDSASTATLCALLCARERVSGLQPEPRRPARRGRATRGVRLRPGAQLDPQGRPARRLRRPEPATHRDRRRPRPAPRPARGGHRRRPGRRPPAVRRGGRGRHHGHHGARPAGRCRRARRAPRPLAARRRRAGRLGDDLPRAALDVGRASSAPTRSC